MTNMNIPDYFNHILDLEAQAIKRTSGLYNLKRNRNHIEKAVELLSKCKGRVIAIGVGKSAIVGHKIAATMTSTGTPSIYLHAGDALHGDLGILSPEDVAIILSYSGETDEISALMPHIIKRQVPIIAIVGNTKSTLAKNATVVFDASIDREACPLNLAPTTSTTVSLAIGDALAMTLMKIKNLKPEQFAINHPAGRLGKRLTMTVSDLMHGGSRNPIVNKKETLMNIITTMSDTSLGGVNVVDDQNKLIGIITDGDLRRTVQESSANLNSLADFTAEQIMTKAPISTTEDSLAFDALKTMEKRKSQISVLPVVSKDNVCLGLIRLHDIVRAGL